MLLTGTDIEYFPGRVFEIDYCLICIEHIINKNEIPYKLPRTDFGIDFLQCGEYYGRNEPGFLFIRTIG